MDLHLYSAFTVNRSNAHFWSLTQNTVILRAFLTRPPTLFQSDLHLKSFVYHEKFSHRVPSAASCGDLRRGEARGGKITLRTHGDESSRGEALRAASKRNTSDSDTCGFCPRRHYKQLRTRGRAARSQMISVDVSFSTLCQEEKIKTKTISSFTARPFMQGGK